MHFAAGVLFLLDDYLKEENFLSVEDIAEHNEACSTQGCCPAHKNIFYGQVDEHLAEGHSRKDTNIFFDKFQRSY